jgi:hypothetical protein
MIVRRLALVLALSSITTEAVAYHTERNRTVAGSAFTLHRNEWQVGLFRADYGALERLQVGTYLLPWIALVPNVQLKLVLLRGRRWAVSLRPGFFYMNLAPIRTLYGLGSEDLDLELYVIPVEAHASVVLHERIVLNGALTYTGVTGSGSYDPADFAGTTAASNLQLGLSLEWRISRIAALTLQGRIVALQDLDGVGNVRVRLDDATTVHVRAKARPKALNLARGSSADLSVLLSWSSFHLRLGIGYGSYNVPGVNLVLPKPRPYPVVDLYWRF